MIIGISGKAGSGKDTISDYIVKNHNFIKIAFADSIKRILMEVYGFTYTQLWGPSEERGKIDPRYGKAVREFIQGFGDKGRELCLSTWINKTVNIIEKVHNTTGWTYIDHLGLQENYDYDFDSKSIIISDGRYLNELEALKKINAKLIRIIRPENNLLGKLGGHSSETDQNEIPNSYFDEIIINNGSLEDLYLKIDNILSKR